MNFNKDNADIFVPDESDANSALAKTTHLAIVAHQDDTEILAYHGIAECYGLKDKWFSSVIVTNGAGSPRSGIYENYTNDEMIDVRRIEQRKAAFVGDFAIQLQLAYPSSEIKDNDNKNAVDDLEKILKTSQPEVLYLHNPADKHDTHIAVLARCIEAIRRLPMEERPQKVYGCEVWRNLDWLDDDEKVFLAVDKYKNLSSALIGIFDSQITGGKRYDLAIQGRRVANATFKQSHAVDQTDMIDFAIDLSPMIQDDSITLADFITAHLDQFKSNVLNAVNKY